MTTHQCARPNPNDNPRQKQTMCAKSLFIIPGVGRVCAAHLTAAERQWNRDTCSHSAGFGLGKCPYCGAPPS